MFELKDIEIASGNLVWSNLSGYYLINTITGETLRIPGYNEKLHKYVGKKISIICKESEAKGEN